MLKKHDLGYLLPWTVSMTFCTKTVGDEYLRRYAQWKCYLMQGILISNNYAQPQQRGGGNAHEMKSCCVLGNVNQSSADGW